MKNVEGENNTKKFYEKSWIMWVLLILFAPVGIFLMWKFHPEMKKNFKIVFTVLFILVFMGELGYSLGSENDVKQISNEVNIESLSVKYYGSMENGAVIDNNSDLTVTANYSNGKSEEVEGWKIEDPVTLEAGKTSTVIISYEGVEKELSLTCTDLTPEQYKEQCISISYDDLARNPDDHKYDYVYLSGDVIQVQENEDEVIFLIDVEQGDTAIAFYTYKEGESRVLEGDQITIYGMYEGLYTYTSVLGAEITVPNIFTRHIEVN